MRVLYDITKLGHAYLSSTDKTGVFRVVDSVYENLVQAASSGVIELYTCSSKSYLDIGACRNLVKSRGPAYEETFCNKTFCDPIIGSAASICQNITKSILTSSGRYHLLLLKAARFMLRHEPESLSQPLIVRSLNTFMTQNHVEVYHSPFFSVPAWLSTTKTRTILTIHDIIAAIKPDLFTNQISTILRNILDSVLLVDAIICVSHHTKWDLCNYFGQRLDPDKVFVTHLAAANYFRKCDFSEQMLYVKRKYNIPFDSRYFLSVNTLEPRKNIGFLIKCFSRLVQQEGMQDLLLVLAGGKGWKYRDIFQELKNSPVRNRIVIAGFVPDEDLSALYSGALAFVYPSLYEGFGLPPLEAMQCGAPVITSDTSSLPEVVGDAGIMIDPTDSDALCESMLTVYSNSALRGRLAEKSLRQARTFSWERCAAETIDVYRTVIDRHTALPGGE